MRYLIRSLGMVCVLVFASAADAGGKGSGSKSSGAPKTVSVKGHYRKDGTYVRPHMRSAPNSGSSISIPTETRTMPRTTARTTARGIPAGADLSAREDETVESSTAASGVVPKKTEEAPIAKRKRLSESKLKYAKQFIRDGKAVIAKQWLNDCIAEYPETEAASEARKILKELEKE